MRPQILYPLFAAVDSLPGVGPRTATLVGKVAGPKVVDLLWHLPTGLLDRRAQPSLARAEPGGLVTLTLRVDGHVPPAGRQPYRIRCSDGTGTVDLVYFHGRPEWLARTFPVGATRVVSGRLEVFNELPQIVHPDQVGGPEDLEAIATVEPVYPLTTGLTPRGLGKAIAAAVAAAPELPEWQPPGFPERQGWPSWRAAIEAAHAPRQAADLDPLAPARARLAYDELLANQLALAVVRRSVRKATGRPTCGDGGLRQQVREALPFRLTGSQAEALAEIEADMAAPTRMLRLLQGDVGSGKTVVAVLAMLNAVETGGQAVLLAPTEILARQHLETVRPLAATAGVDVGLLTGREKGRPRAQLLERLSGGDLPILVGTHALLQDDVAFADLALTVIDEQHRFGVDQRLRLSAKGPTADLLVMTATPIPRTLQLTAYGDMDASRIIGRPPGRQPVDTRTVPLDRLDEVVDAVGRKLDGGAKAYWVCPLVGETDQSDLADARRRYERLATRFGARVGLVHGRMRSGEKDAVMAAFAGDGIDLLVATTVIEVGVNVPAATLMVVEHAERFGLAQLHQLRGRVGRGAGASTCLLLYAGPLGETARARLSILRETDDGFRIAEEDLRLRGAGELLGTRQSGLPEGRIAELSVHGELLSAARDEARALLEQDPELTSGRGDALRVLLYLLERDAAIRYLRSG